MVRRPASHARRTTMLSSLLVLVLVLAIVAVAYRLTGWPLTGRQPATGAGPSTTAPSRASVAPSSTPSSVVTTSPSSKPTSKPSSKPIPPPAGVPKRPKNAQPLVVRYVYDGDTLQLQAAKSGAYVTTTHKIKVRLIGVDTPEMTPKKECYAQQATNRLKVLAKPGSTVWVAPDRDSWDDYQRRLFLVWNADGTLIDHALVAEGFGVALRIWPNVTYSPVLAVAQAKAQKAKRGLWGTC